MSDDEDVQYVKRPRTIHYGSLEETERKRQTAQQQQQQQQQQQEDNVSGAKTSDNGAEKPTEQFEEIESEDENYEESNKKTTSALPIEPLPTAGTLAKRIDDDYFDIDNEVSKEKLALLAEFERKRRARQINVSTDDIEVKINLRQLNEPICFFGEGPAERRRRLKELLASLGENAIKLKQTEEHERRQQQKEQETTWYHEGPETLRVARLWIANFSLARRLNVM